MMKKYTFKETVLSYVPEPEREAFSRLPGLEKINRVFTDFINAPEIFTDCRARMSDGTLVLTFTFEGGDWMQGRKSISSFEVLKYCDRVCIENLGDDELEMTFIVYDFLNMVAEA